MPLDINDYFEQVDRFSVEDVPPEVRVRINEALADLTGNITGPQGQPSEGPSPGDPDAVVVSNTEGEGDVSTIQAAVDDPGTDPGDTILIRAGEYATDGEVTVTDPGELRLVGAGSGSDPSSNTVIQSQIEVEVTESSGNGVALQDLRITGVSDDGAEIDTTVSFGGSALREIGVENVAFVDNTFEGLDIQEPAEDLAVRDCLIENNGDNGIEGEEITNAVVSNCEILRNGGNGIDIEDTETLTIRGCTVQDNFESGIEFDGDSSNITISDSDISGNLIKGVEFDGDGVGITVTGSTIENNVEQGIVTNELIDSSSNITDAEFRRTTVRDNGFEGIGLFSNNISKLVFEDLDVSSNFLEGIDLFGSDIGEIEIANVTADDNGGIGIALGDTFDEIISTVSEVEIRDTNVDSNGSEGVLIATEQINDLIFTNVSASNNEFEGIDVFGNDVGAIKIGDVTANNNGGIGVALGGTIDGDRDPMTVVSTVDISDTSADGNLLEGVLVGTEKISDLSLTNLSASDNDLEGIDLFGNTLSTVSISRVTARANGGIGIFAGNSVDDASIEDLSITKSVIAESGSDGVLVAGDITNAAITKSNIVDNAFAGVFKRNATGTVTVEDSFISRNSDSTVGNITTAGLRSSSVADAGADGV